MSISAVVLTKNEEGSIGRCLSALKWCDELIVIDDYSIDKTIKIAKSLGTKVYQQHLNNNFARQRNFALKKLRSDWAIFVDADEVVSKELAVEIKEKIKNTVKDGYLIKRSDFWNGKRLKFGESGAICLVRLGKVSAGKWKRSVHEYWDIKNMGKLKSELFHYPHDSVSKFIDQINFHSQLHARENLKESKKSSIFKIIFYPIGKFINNYLIKQGFRDGVHGFVVAVIMSLHSFLSWSSLWLQQKQTKS